jgi:hypothetical protein
MQGENRMNNQNNAEIDTFFEIRKSERKEWQKLQRKEEAQNFRRIMRLAKKLCPIDYVKLCYEIQFRLNINYNHTQKAPYSRYLDTLIGIGKLKKAEDGTVTLGDA